ncbi:MAG: hypothetical protein ACE5GH_01865 [Fidelibacterota bacterium]
MRFWDLNWQGIVFSYIDTIMAHTLDGIYCDIMGAYYTWSQENPENRLQRRS